MKATKEEVAQALQQLADQQGEDTQKVASARMGALCKRGYANLDSLYCERIAREQNERTSKSN